jgi:hypothetical protein
MDKILHIEKLGLVEKGGYEVAHTGSANNIICARVKQRRRTAADNENETCELRATYAAANIKIMRTVKELNISLLDDYNAKSNGENQEQVIMTVTVIMMIMMMVMVMAIMMVMEMVKVMVMVMVINDGDGNML